MAIHALGAAFEGELGILVVVGVRIAIVVVATIVSSVWMVSTTASAMRAGWWGCSGVATTGLIRSGHCEQRERCGERVVLFDCCQFGCGRRKR